MVVCLRLAPAGRAKTTTTCSGSAHANGFSPRKAQLTFYGLKDLPEALALLPELGRYTEGVGCIYARKLEDLDLDVLRRVIAIAWSRGGDPEPA
jgi:hypothetical protein